MPRAKTSEPSRVRLKAATIEELTRGVGNLQEFLAQVEDLGREGFPYLDAARARTELQFRECIRRTFGEKSPEFQEHRHHKLLMDSPEGTQQSIALIKTLIATLEQKKRDLQGGPSPQQVPPSPSASPISAPARQQMAVVPASISTVKMIMSQTEPIMLQPVTMTTNLDLAPVTAVPSPPPAPPIPPAASQKSEPLSASTSVPELSPSSPVSVAMAMPHTPSQPVAPVTPEPQPSPSQAVQTMPADISHVSRPPQLPQREPEPSVHPIPPAGLQPKMQEALPVLPNLQPHPSMPISSSLPLESGSQRAHAGSDPVELVKAVCRRFHAVVRQLRLRGEYRATLQVEDEVDAQDLLHALLRIQFNNIDTDEWTPSYSSGAPRTTLLLNESRLAVIVKKTRSGLTAKDLTDQLRIDAARYRFHGHCTTLLCFMYDPDGRIGNAQGLEASLTSVNDSFVVDVLVAPK
ncbi:MAG TPA: hypothetical protein VK901_18830 [Nitrospiraceae bacterium]|nr:hypothetical protein [Nitrospiraceae bacterium]